MQARRKLFVIGGGAETEGRRPESSAVGASFALRWREFCMLARKIFKSRVCEMPFHGLWGKDLTEF